MPPLQLNDEEMNVLLTLAAPIDHRLRPQFLQEVAKSLRRSDKSVRVRCIGWRARFSANISPRRRSARAGTGAHEIP